MSVFIIPAIVQPKDNEFIEVASRAGLEVASVVSAPLHELYRYLLDSKHVIVQLDPEQLALLSRHATQLLPEMPVIVMSVPGSVYTRDFEMFANSFMMEEWETFRRRLAKSGTFSQDVNQLEERSLASNYSDSLASNSRTREKQQAKTPNVSKPSAQTFDKLFESELGDGSDIGG